MAENKKISEKQLEEIQKINDQFLRAKVSIADIELQKSQILAQLSSLQGQFKAIEDKLIEEYGNDAVIDLKTGEVKPPQDKKENGKNK